MYYAIYLNEINDVLCLGLIEYIQAKIRIVS